MQSSVLDKVTSVELRIAEQRSDLTDLKHSLTDTDTHLTRIQQSFRTLSDDLAELDSQLEVDRYLEKMIGKLIQYGRAMRLVVCYVDPPSTGNPQPHVPSCRKLNNTRHESVKTRHQNDV